MFPKVPENLRDKTANTTEALAALYNEMLDAKAAFESEHPDLGTCSIEEIREFKACLDGMDAVKAELGVRDIESLSEQHTDPVAPPAAPVASDETPDPVDDPPADPPADPAPADPAPVDPADPVEPELTTPSGLSTGAVPEPSKPAAPKAFHTIKVREDLGVVTDPKNVQWNELGKVIQAKAELIGDSDQRYRVAEIVSTLPEEATLTGDELVDFDKLTAPFVGDQDLTAALCGPMTQITALSNIPLDTARSVTPGIPRYNADAANVRVWQAPSFSATDFSDGIGQWTSTNDAAVTLTGGPRKGCFEIPCPSALDYELYAVWSCIEVSNLLAISFPELITRYADIGLANHSQLADDLALAFIRAATAVDYRDGNGTLDPLYGVTLRTLRTMARARADYIQKERYVEGVTFDAWLPKSLAWFYVLDLMSRRVTTGTVPSITPADVTALFARFGFDVHWYQDPTFSLSTTASGVFVEKANEDIVIRAAPKGKFRFIDKGRLNVGVMGSGGFRDSELVARNRFRVFFETFETVIDTFAAPAIDINITNACANGVQIDDIPMACFGQAVS